MRKRRWLMIMLLVSFCLFLQGSKGPAERSRGELPRFVTNDEPLTAVAYRSPALNPQVPLLAYIAVPQGVINRGERTYRQNLWTMNLVTREVEQQSRESVCLGVAWSPNGMQMAVAAKKLEVESPHGGLWLVTLGERRARRIISTDPPDAPLSPVWSPSEPNLLAFISSMEPLEGTNPDRIPLIWTIDIGGVGKGILTPYPLPEGTTLCDRSGITFSHDGRKLYFLAQEQSEDGNLQTSIWTLELENRSFEKVLGEEERYQYASLAHSPVEEQIALLFLPKHVRRGAKAFIRLLDLPEKRIYRVHEIELLEEGVIGDFSSCLSWDATGRRLAYVQGQDIWLLNLATAEELAALECKTKLTILHKAFREYAKDHNGELPSPEHDPSAAWRQDKYFWIDALSPILEDTELVTNWLSELGITTDTLLPRLEDSQLLKCTSLETQPSSYQFNRNLWGKRIAEVVDSRTVPLLTESEARHQGKRNVLYVDGHIAAE